MGIRRGAVSVCLAVGLSFSWAAGQNFQGQFGPAYHVNGLNQWTHANCSFTISNTTSSSTSSTITLTAVPTCVLVGDTFLISGMTGTNSANYDSKTFAVTAVNTSSNTITFATPANYGSNPSGGGTASNFVGETMPDAILTLTGGGAGVFYEENCAEPAYPTDLFHLVSGAYVQLYLLPCTNPIQTSATQMPYGLDAIRGLPLARGEDGAGNFGGPVLQASSFFQPPIADPAPPPSYTSGSGCSGYAASTMYYEITLVSPAGADTAHSVEATSPTLNGTGTPCWQIVLPQAAQANMYARIYTSTTSGGELYLTTQQIFTSGTTTYQINPNGLPTVTNPNGPSATNATGALVLVNSESSASGSSGPGVKAAQFGAVVSDITLDGNALAAVCLYQNMGQEGSYVENVDMLNCPGGGATSNAAAIFEGHIGGVIGGIASTLCNASGGNTSCTYGPNNSYAINLRVNDASLKGCYDSSGNIPCNPGAGVQTTTGATAGSQGTASLTHNMKPVSQVSGSLFQNTGAWNSQNLFFSGPVFTVATTSSGSFTFTTAVNYGSASTAGTATFSSGCTVNGTTIMEPSGTTATFNASSIPTCVQPNETFTITGSNGGSVFSYNFSTSEVACSSSCASSGTSLTLNANWGGATGVFSYAGLAPGYCVELDQVASFRTLDGLTCTPDGDGTANGITTVGVEALGFGGYNPGTRIQNIHNEGHSPWMQYAVECRGLPCLVEHVNSDSATQSTVVHLSGSSDLYGEALRSNLQEIEPYNFTGSTRAAVQDDINSITTTPGSGCEFYRVGGTTGDYDGCNVNRPVANGGTGVASLTAYMPVVGGTTSTGPLQAVGTGSVSGQPLTYQGTSNVPTFSSTPQITTALDANGNNWLGVTPTASAVDYFNILNGATGSPGVVTLGTAGSDTNIELELTSTGTGPILVKAASNSTNTFEVQPNGSATNILDVDTTHNRVGITATPGATFDVASKFQVNGSGLPIKSNNLSLQGQGFPLILGVTSQRSETGGDSNVLTVTPATAPGTYRLNFTISVSSASSAKIGWTATWTDSNGAAQSPANLALFQSGNNVPGLTFTTSTASDYYGTALIDVDNSGTNIVLKFTLASGTVSAKVSATVEQLI